MTTTQPLTRAQREAPPGIPVAVHPGGRHRPEDHWIGVVIQHRDLGLSDVECTDPNGFWNKWAGLVTTVDARSLRLGAAQKERRAERRAS